MADAESQTPSQRFGWGIGLAFAGGLSMIGSVQVLEGGTLSVGTLLEMNLGGGPAGVTVHDGPVSLRCDPRWAVQPFVLGKTRRLDGDTAAGDEPPPGQKLAGKVGEVAAAIAADASSGTILLIGSGDPFESRAKNAPLAKARAETVRQLLSDDLARRQPGAAPRQILLGNEALTYSEREPGPDTPSVGLARLLYGAEEASARSVQACVLEPRGHSVEAWSSGEPSGWRWAWFLGGWILSAFFTLIVLWAALRRGARTDPN